MVKRYWQNTDKLATAVDKLVQCNEKLGIQIIHEDDLHLSLDKKKYFHKILEVSDICSSAPNSKAAADVFRKK